MSFVDDLIDKLQGAFPVNRIVAFLTPLVFVPVSAFAAAWAAEHFPGLPQFSPGEITAFMGIGATAALAAGYKWLDGWQKHEAQAAEGSAAVKKSQLR